ncbi:nucleoside recognition domain-containing protein [Anaerocellum danielii]|uniref:Nucleoside recognition protein n=1 Tax=Anaerocellum danielii TaxID=1387557 RepID=A0ABZ0TZM0_9FIRM|nr:nucleoside recognition domain-containing protein [Caldicellulosiruptor danielii]WPX08662.1 nucleoside recognition protein [Caldicellulosiruptor danielii]
MIKVISDLIIVSFIVFVFIFSIFHSNDSFKSFVEGVKDGIRISIRIFPNVFTLILAVELFTRTEALNVLVKLIGPILNQLGIFKEALGLLVIKPFSSSASYAVLKDIFSRYGPDSQIGIYSSIICASTETLFYVITTYLAQTKVKRTRYLIPVAVAVDFVVLLTAAFLVKSSFR